MGYISGTLKYEVLKRAQFHCEVDHIIPREDHAMTYRSVRYADLDQECKRKLGVIL